MQIDLRYSDGRPDWRAAGERLREARTVTRSAEAAISLERVATNEEAAGPGFRSSPTVLIDGRDLFAEGAETGLARRVFAIPEGLQGAPTVDQLRAALGA